MNLLSSMVAPAGARAGTVSFAMLLRLALLLVCAMAGHAASAASGGVYIAGQGMSLEQAFEQALAEHPGAARDTFWIVAAGDEAARLAGTGSGSALSEALKKVRGRGGVVYVCRSDMMIKGIKEEDLPEGVASVYGYGSQEWAGLLPARKEGVVLPENLQQSQLILRTCAGDGMPGKT